MVNQSGKFFSRRLLRGGLTPLVGLVLAGGMAACGGTESDGSPSLGTGTGGLVGTGGTATGTGGLATGTGGVATGTGGTATGTGGALTGTGGLTGSGGSGGGSTAVSCFQVASTSFLGFDDYDGASADPSFLVAGPATGGVYMGPWNLTDETDETNPDPAPTYARTMVTGFGDAGYALKISDQEAKNWGGGVGFWMSNCVDAATYNGIRLQVRGSVPTGSVRLEVSTRDTDPPSDGGVGACDAGAACKDGAAEFALAVSPTEWQQVDLPWSSFTGGVGSGSVAAPLSGFGITGLTFSVSVNYDEVGPIPGPYELSIDQIGFF